MIQVSNEHFPEFFAEQLRSMRTIRGLTQAELGRRAELQESWVSQFEIGSRLPSMPVFRRLVIALDCKPELLLGIVPSAETAAGKGGE